MLIEQIEQLEKLVRTAQHYEYELFELRRMLSIIENKSSHIIITVKEIGVTNEASRLIHYGQDIRDIKQLLNRIISHEEYQLGLLDHTKI